MAAEPRPTLAPPDRGTFLIAAPRLLDPNFFRTVVLLCAHGPEGSYGLVVNRPGTSNLGDLGSDNVLLAGREDPLWMGGPVQLDTLQVLHRLGPDVPGSVQVVGATYLGGDAEALRVRLDREARARDVVRFVLGYSGWGEGQLEREVESGGWVVCPAREALVFDPEPATVWRRALRALGGEWERWASEPPDPSWN